MRETASLIEQLVSDLHSESRVSMSEKTFTFLYTVNVLSHNIKMSQYVCVLAVHENIAIKNRRTCNMTKRLKQVDVSRADNLIHRYGDLFEGLCQSDGFDWIGL